MINGEAPRWRPVVGYEGLYEVSDDGRIKSLARTTTGRNGTPRQLPEKILQGSTTSSNRYPSVRLTRARGESEGRLIHHLVLEAFVGPRPEGMQGLHRDDDRNNNSLSNLYWGTFEDNARDKNLNGRNGNANKTHCIHGHEYTPENTIINCKGRRECATCKKRWSATTEERRLAKQNAA